MSSIPNHGLQGITAATLFLFTMVGFGTLLSPTHLLFLCIVSLISVWCARYSILPDVFGIAGGSDRGDFKLYNNAHNQNPDNVKVFKKYQWNPLYYFHVWQDKYTHGPGQRWWVWNERLWVEVLTDAIQLTFLTWFYGWPKVLILIVFVAVCEYLLALNVIDDVHNGKYPETQP